MAETKTCGACLSEIPAAAVRCAHCGTDPRGPRDWSSVREAALWFTGGLTVMMIGFAIGGGVGQMVLTLGVLVSVPCALIAIWEAFADRRHGDRALGPADDET